MVNISKSGNAIKFQFTDSDHYLYGNGVVECPVNSLSLVIDESDFVTFKKASTNDTFITFDPANSNLSDKAGVIEFYKTNMVGSTGGGSESGITPSEVQEMIDESLEDYYTDDEVDAALSGKASASDVTALENEVATKADTSAVTAVASDVSTLSGQVATKVAISDFNAYSATTDARIAEDEEVTAAALNDLQENKADTSAVTAAIDAAISGKADTSAVTAVANDVTVLSGAVDDAKAYYISFATLATQGISDDDWDGIVAAIDDHRPIYAGYPRQDGGIIYYGVECMNKNSGNTEIVMTASDNSVHYFYTFTKNGSNDYSYTVSTKPYVPDITTAITSGSTDAEIPTAKAVYDAIPTGGGATYSAGSGIAIDTANTISVSEPIHAFGHNVMIGESTYNPFKSSTSSSFGVGSSHNFKNSIRKSVAFGESNTVNSDDCLAQGSYVTVNNIYEAGFGRRNNSVTGSTESGQTLFSVGNGTSSANHNAFEIRHNGDIYFPDTDNTTYANYYQKPMVRLQDMYGALGGLKLVKLTQSEYDQLATKDPDTLYIITNVVS